MATKCLVLGAMLAALVAGRGAAAVPPAAVWCVGESTKVKPGDAPQDANLTWNGAAKTVTLGSARNEYVAFQIAVRSAKDELKDVTVVVGDLKGPGSSVIPAASPVAMPSGEIETTCELPAMYRVPLAASDN